jgi:carboxymethylenebutenolidase
MRSYRLLTGVCVLAGLAACHRQPAMDEHTAHMSAADMSPPAVGAPTRSAAQEDMNLPASANNAPARLQASNRHAEWVKIAWEPGSKDSLMAWVVYPSTNRAKSPVVVVVHEIFGLQTWVRGVADQVAAAGFIAIAPDLLSRVRGGATTHEMPGDSARAMIQGVNVAERNLGITAAARYAMSLPSADNKYAVIGYCWGGTTTWGYAINGGLPGFSGGVAFYGLPYMQPRPEGQAGSAIPVVDSLRKITKPVMLLSGTGDPRITAGMPAVDSVMKALGKSYVGINYEGAEHGFLRAQADPKNPRNPAQEQANMAATKDGWPRTIAFLKKQLGI